MKICMFNRLYQDSIIVRSRASTALKIKFEVPAPLVSHMEILPKSGYIQAGKSTELSQYALAGLLSAIAA